MPSFVSAFSCAKVLTDEDLLFCNLERIAMPGMNTLGSPGVSDYQNRTVTLEVAGVCQQSVMKTSNYQVRVPYSQMSQALNNINHQGGKVVSVQLMGNPPARAVMTEASASADADQVNSEPAEAAPKKRSSKRNRR